MIDELSKKFLVAAVAYTGFDESDTENYRSVEDELGRIERYVNEHYSGHICAAYGCSLGGTFVATSPRSITSTCTMAFSAAPTLTRRGL